MKDTLNFYNKIYEPLFKKEDYNKSLHRGKVALKKFKEFSEKNDIHVDEVIDIGCSWGKTLKYWKKKKKIKACGVDVANTTVDFCKQKGYECYLASATNLSIFKDKQFDLYIATDIYEHLRMGDLKFAINEAKRITKKYLLIRPHPALDKRGRADIRKALHLTVWDLNKWQLFFGENDLNVIPIGDNGEIVYKNVFLMSINN